MSIKCSKSALIYLAFAWIIVIIFPLILIIDSHNSNSQEFIALIIVVTIILQIIILRACLIIFKKIDINKNGCSVKFLFFKKTYTWDMLKTKSIEHYGQRLFGRINSYEKGCVFSVKKNFHTPEIMGISSYLFSCINPFRFFVVLFSSKDSKGSGLFEVDEQLFMEKMNEWGIELQEYKNGKFSPYKNEAGKIQD